MYLTIFYPTVPENSYSEKFFLMNSTPSGLEPFRVEYDPHTLTLDQLVYSLDLDPIKGNFYQYIVRLSRSDPLLNPICKSLPQSIAHPTNQVVLVVSDYMAYRRLTEAFPTANRVYYHNRLRKEVFFELAGKPEHMSFLNKVWVLYKHDPERLFQLLVTDPEIYNKSPNLLGPARTPPTQFMIDLAKTKPSTVSIRRTLTKANSLQLTESESHTYAQSVVEAAHDAWVMRALLPEDQTRKRLPQHLSHISGYAYQISQLNISDILKVYRSPQDSLERLILHYYGYLN